MPNRNGTQRHAQDVQLRGQGCDGCIVFVIRSRGWLLLAPHAPAVHDLCLSHARSLPGHCQVSCPSGAHFADLTVTRCL